MASKKVGGTVYIKVDGQQLSVSGDVEVPVTDVSRESKRTSTGVVYTETDLVPYVKVSVVMDDSFPRDDLVDGDDMTVTADLPNGNTYVLSEAFLVNPAALKGNEGTVELEFHGSEGAWQ